MYELVQIKTHIGWMQSDLCYLYCSQAFNHGIILPNGRLSECAGIGAIMSERRDLIEHLYQKCKSIAASGAAARLGYELEENKAPDDDHKQ
jgi:hypothetical protein